LLLLQIVNSRQVLSDIHSDGNSLDQFIDQIEDNEYKIHRGIANGRYEQQLKNEAEDGGVEEDDFGVMLLNVSISQLVY
jgi:hypothetical protein